jgi:hypothetical protein
MWYRARAGAAHRTIFGHYCHLLRTIEVSRGLPLGNFTLISIALVNSILSNKIVKVKKCN